MKNIALFFLVILFISCSKDNLEPTPSIDLNKVGEGYLAGAATKLELYTEKNIETGFTPLYIALYDSASNKAVKSAAITVLPVMDMVSMKHASPVENPLSTTATGNLFPVNVVFTMPSGDAGSWTLTIKATVNGKAGELTLPVMVDEPRYSRLRTFTSLHDGSKYFIAYIEPSRPKVGVNEMEIAIYRKKTMMEFPADSSLTVTLTPEMPSMDHGSPNNVDPVHMGKGHYKGKVNFTMTGLWQLNLDFMHGDAIADTTSFFEVNF